MYYSEFRTSELRSSEQRGCTSEFRKWFSEYSHSEFRHSELRHSEFRGYTEYFSATFALVKPGILAKWLVGAQA